MHARIRLLVALAAAGVLLAAAATMGVAASTAASPACVPAVLDASARLPGSRAIGSGTPTVKL